MDSHDQAWKSFRERLNIHSSLGDFVATVAGRRGKLPFAAHSSVRVAFDQLLGDELLALCRDGSLSTVCRLRYVGQLFGHVAAAIEIYGAASDQARPNLYEAELLILFDFAVRACSTSMALVSEAKAHCRLRGESLADDLRSVAESNCRFFNVVANACARDDFFSNEPRGALLLTLWRKTQVFIEELAADQLIQLYVTASRRSNCASDGLLWRQIAEVVESERGDTILRMARLGACSSASAPPYIATKYVGVGNASQRPLPGDHDDSRFR